MCVRINNLTEISKVILRCYHQMSAVAGVPNDKKTTVSHSTCRPHKEHAKASDSYHSIAYDHKYAQKFPVSASFPSEINPEYFPNNDGHNKIGESESDTGYSESEVTQNSKLLSPDQVMAKSSQNVHQENFSSSATQNKQVEVKAEVHSDFTHQHMDHPGKIFQEVFSKDGLLYASKDVKNMVLV